MPQCQRYNEYEIDPINTNCVELKIGYNFDLGFKLEINIDVKHTVNIVAGTPFETGKNINENIAINERNGGNFFKSSVKTLLFSL